ncbi:hypothetical protein SLA2020_369750 [Shorea laevis]
MSRTNTYTQTPVEQARPSRPPPTDTQHDRNRTVNGSPALDIGTRPNMNSSFLDRLLFRRRRRGNYELEDIIDMDRDLTIFSEQQLSGMNPRTLYSVGSLTRSTSLFRHRREVSLSVPDGQIINLPLISPEAASQLQRRDHNFIHLGLIVIGVRGLTMRGLGTKIFLMLYDNRHSKDRKKIIGLCEIDMGDNLGITYIAPGYPLSIRDFIKHIKIQIQTKGYPNFAGVNLY